MYENGMSFFKKKNLYDDGSATVKESKDKLGSLLTLLTLQIVMNISIVD